MIIKECNLHDLFSAMYKGKVDFLDVKIEGGPSVIVLNFAWPENPFDEALLEKVIRKYSDEVDGEVLTYYGTHMGTSIYHVKLDGDVKYLKLGMIRNLKKLYDSRDSESLPDWAI